MQAPIESCYDQFIDDLKTLVNMDSGSNYPPGLTAVRDFFLNRFTRLGWQTKLHAFLDGSAPCLEAASPAPLLPNSRFEFLFIGHMDTVFAEGTAATRPFSIQNGRAMGPAVGDMKAGLVTMLHVAEIITRDGMADNLPICMAFNSDEEVGSKGSRSWIEALAKKSKRVLVFESTRASGHRVIQRKGTGSYEVTCNGRAAHAGVEPEKGINAVVELAHQILKISDFARPELGTTVSTTVVSGGTAENVIPDSARVAVDVRFATIEEARRVEACFKQAPKNPEIEGAQIQVKGGIGRLPMVPSEKTERLWERIAGIGRNMGLDMKLASTGGGSDGNFTAALGVPTIDAMGPIGGNAHSDREYVELSSITPNLKLIYGIVKAAAEGTLP
jgi:glutamate carboxypeptidase